MGMCLDIAFDGDRYNLGECGVDISHGKPVRCRSPQWQNLSEHKERMSLESRV